MENNNNKPFRNGNVCCTIVRRVGDGRLLYNITDNMKNVNINPVRNEPHNINPLSFLTPNATPPKLLLILKSYCEHFKLSIR